VNIVLLSQAFVLLCLFAVANSTATAQYTLPKSAGATGLYIENKGQIGDQHGKPNHDVRYLLRYGTLAIQLRNNGFSYDEYSASEARPSHRVVRRIDVDLVHPSPTMRIAASSPGAEYRNYFTHITAQSRADQGATEVRGYATVTYHDVWPGIDMEWHIDAEGRPQYRLNLREGADSANIRFHVRGADAFNHTTMIANASPMPPISAESGGFMKPFAATRWGTYVGGSASNRALAVAVAPGGDVVVAGLTMADEAIATSGAYQVEMLGETWDACVVVLAADGSTRRWGTYLGGGMSDVATSVDVLENGDIVVGGETQSAAGIATSGAHQTVFGGVFDGFVAVLSADGATMRWATYVGGPDRDAVNAVRVTPQGAIVAAGTTQSPSGLATAGSHQIGYAGATDGFVLSFSGEGQRQWGTYVGGAGTDEALALSARGSSIVVAGTTGSRTNIATTGVFQPVFGGGTEDGFLAILDGTLGTRRWGSYVGGEGFDVVLGVDEHTNGDIIVGGETRSTSGLASPGALQASNAGGRGDGFVGVVSPGGQERRWFTYVGGEQLDGVYGVTAMGTADVVAVGRTASPSSIATAAAAQTTLAGGEDGFVVVINASGTEKTYGSYIGGLANDAATAVASAAPGTAVIVGRTSSTTGIGTPGSFQSSPGGEFDGFCVGYSALPLRIQHSDASAQVLHCWPVPATEVLHASVTKEGPMTLRLFDMTGRQVANSRWVEHASVGHVEQWDVRGLVPGMYTLHYSTPTGWHAVGITIMR